MIDDDMLAKLFCDLVSIQSPSGKEKEVAMFVKERLDSLGVKGYFDNANRMTKSNTGNLIATLGSGKPGLLFVAHMDTVESEDSPIEPVIRNGIIRPKGDTILGADDKAGVTAMLHAAETLVSDDRSEELPRATFVFSINEEASPAGMGIEYLKLKDKSRIDHAFSLDGSQKPGTFFDTALGTKVVEISIKGREAHALMRPQKGANALRAAALAITNMPIGKRRDGSVLNIGQVSGGGTTTAVVPGKAEMIGEFGAFDGRKVALLEKEIERAVGIGCKATGCRYRIRWRNDMYLPPYRADLKSGIIRIARAASGASGLRFSTVPLQSVSEYNALGATYGSAVGMCRGGRLAHSTKEHAFVKEFGETSRLIVNIVKEAGRTGAANDNRR
jgi:tripeptide aminopeptidase